ncbi:EAL domain-containing protein [Pseudoalteromonas distincta]|jgi:diguanylate cyclase (GGDEF)-like protein|uniref:bifunctional diguanylate cyclase/phosphodiesterase n=1 Tax=Pseudoalteromonas distincta TaxID=77608 RepID=UPI0011916D2C|nr:EAL domain-containing protein [Pseudoalteromonas elyakovii]TVU72161.1 EAL domain-containing protein [Pseudoalteromonas elyakovii]|tara:strand:- start:209 stop:2398 length:2190 start_codon:yes stop_codon:yes gene_type:complete
MSSDQNDFLFFEQDYEDDAVIEPTKFWDILIVDDEPEIHSVTKLALSGVEFLGAGLRFHDAYSGAEAIEILAENNDISVIFLDVIMETDDAGLQVVKRVRDELNNQHVRIILRTGQAGNIPEEKVIREYDINDYKTKTELTRSKLVTSLITAIRSYEQVCQLEYQSDAMNTIVSASKSILGLTDIKQLCKEIIKHMSIILKCSPRGLVCSKLDGDDFIQVLGGCGHYEDYFGEKLINVDSKVFKQVELCFDLLKHQHTDSSATFVLKSKHRKAALYIECDHVPLQAQLQFAEIFLTNVSVALDNIRLFVKLRDAAYKDVLTGISNRTNFIERVERYQKPHVNDYVFVLLDIVNFADINNGLGQEVGNKVLIGIVQRLKENYPTAKLLSRIGADVFGFIIRRDELDLKKLNEQLGVPFCAEEHTLPIDFRLGLCQQQDFQSSGIDTLKVAYIALDQAKKAKHKEGVYYNIDMQDKMAWRIGIIRQLRHDFARNKLEVWYQPQLSLGDLSLIGCEALLRWPTGNGSYISPAVFVPLAEDAGLIVDIGQWVLEQACQQQKRLENMGTEICIAVNVSVPQFKVKGYAQNVKNTLLKYGVKPKNIELEVTESVVMDELETVINTLRELQELGIEVAIDDFGTGFSSLSYIQSLPLDRLKIDRAFIKDLPNDDTGAIAALVISLGAKLGLKTIAEGVETQEQAQFLKNLGCDEVQGFMYAKPMPEHELIEFINKR